MIVPGDMLRDLDKELSALATENILYVSQYLTCSHALC